MLFINTKRKRNKNNQKKIARTINKYKNNQNMFFHTGRDRYKKVFFKKKKAPAGASTRSTGLVYTQKYKKVFFQETKKTCGSVHPQHRTCIHPKNKKVFFQKKKPCGSVHPQHRTCIHSKI